MKKIFSFIIAFVMMITLANAQTVEHSKLFDNTYVTLTGGVTTTGQFVNVPTPFFWDGAKSVYNGLRPLAALELGKNITPAFGVSVEGVGFYNTTSSSTFFDELAVLGNAKLNLSNWLAGYKGQPRRIEFVLVGGLGYGHDFVGKDQTWTSYNEEGKWVVGTTDVNAEMGPTDKNYVVYQAAGEMNFNLGKERAWQINLRPGVMWFNKYNGNFQSLPTWKHDARVNVQLGVTYKFGKAGYHNFRLCPYSVTQEAYDAVLSELEAEKNKPVQTKEIIRETVRTERVIEKETKVLVGTTVITFPIGSCVLSNVEKQKVALFADTFKDDDTLIKLVGSADSKTGSENRNFALAQNRANVVKNVLVNEFGISEDRITVETKLDVLEDAEATRCTLATVK